MGGTGVLQFCGDRNLQLVISRRCPYMNPHVAGNLSPYWGFSIVRREPPSEGRRSSMYMYLVFNSLIPRFQQEVIQIPEIGSGTQELPALEWGTIIKMYEYEMTGLKTNILFDFYNQANLLLPRVGLEFPRNSGLRDKTVH
jgi:hypothetical protein